MADAHAEKIAALEKELMEKQAELNELRRASLREKVEDYTFQAPNDRQVRLSELFGDHRDLIVIHNMGSSCPYCTLWADGFNGQIGHFQNRAGFVLVSPDAPETQEKFAASRGWKMPMVSSQGSTFTRDMGYEREWEGKVGPWPGFSTFRREDDGSIVRVAHSSFGPGDPYCGLWHMIGVLADGADGWQPRFSY